MAFDEGESAPDINKMSNNSTTTKKGNKKEQPSVATLKTADEQSMIDDKSSAIIDDDAYSAATNVLETSNKKKRKRPQISDDKEGDTMAAASLPSKCLIERQTTEKMKVHAAKLQEKWNAKFNGLLAFKKSYGHCQVPMIYEADRSLSEWVIKQRENYQRYNDMLSLYTDENNADPKLKERVEELNEMGFCWNPQLQKERIEQLENIGFCWDPTDVLPDDSLPSPAPTTQKTSRESKVEKKWNANFQKLLDFKTANGHCNVPLKYKADVPLGRWVSKQREDFRGQGLVKPMSEVRIARLNEIGFCWNTKSKSKVLSMPATPFDSFQDKETVTEGEPNPSLPSSGDDRDQHMQKKRKTAIQMMSPDSKLEIRWNTNFQKLVDFKTVNGHCNVPLKYKADRALGRWVGRQREDLKGSGSANPMSQVRKARLKEIGFCWDMKNQPKVALNTDMSFNSTQGATKTSEGRAIDEGMLDEDALEAASMPPATTVRKRKMNRATPEMQNYYANLQERWNEKFQELVLYEKEHGTLNVPLKCKANPALGRWVKKQREDYRGLGLAHPMPQERITQLNEIGFEWKVKDDTNASADSLSTRFWNERMNELVAYKEEYGNCIVPGNWPKNPKLAGFVARVRRAFRMQQRQEGRDVKPSSVAAKDVKKGNTSSSPRFGWLTKERIEKLNEIGFVWAIRKASADELWEEKYQKLKAYKEQFGDCRVMKSHDKALNAWTLNQRSAYKYTMVKGEKGNDPNRQTLSAERIAKLQILGFEWDLSKTKNEVAWETRFRELISFKSEHQHCRVPKQYKHNMKLSNWVYDQRKNYRCLRSGKGGKGLTEERIQRLEVRSL